MNSVQIVYIIFMMCTLCRSELMYTKRIPHFDKLFYKFCIPNLAAIVLLILYTKYVQKFFKIWDTLWMHFVYIVYTSVYIHLVQFLYTKCIHNFYAGGEK